MINKNDIVRAINIYHHVCYQRLSSNVLHNGYFDECISLGYLFRWNYEKDAMDYMTFTAILSDKE